MKHRAIFGSVLLACAGIFGNVALAAEDCGPLKRFTSAKLIPMAGVNLVPVSINGVSKALLLDTGGYMSQLSRQSVAELKLPLHDSAVQIADLSGSVSRSFVIADTLTLGTLTAQHLPLMVSPANRLSDDGILSSDLLLRYDVEMDFPGKTISYFSPDHCKGNVVYWHPDVVAAVPITILDKSRLMVPVTLDGKSFRAMIDTGASRTMITMPVAKYIFGLEPGSPGMDPGGNVNADPKLASFTHVFKSLTFEGISVNNPKVLIVPERMATADKSEQTGNRALTNGAAFYTVPELVLGMDVMSHLRMYMAFRESTLYVSAGAVTDGQEKAPTLAHLDELLAASPNNPTYLNVRCYMRGLAKIDLDGALADCELSLKLRPGDSHVLDSKGFVLYQLGRYPEALETYNQALAIDPKQSPSLFMRGHTKQKLGDAAGGDADITAAKAMNPNVLGAFRGSDIAAN
jgi:hypothetical protein